MNRSVMTKLWGTAFVAMLLWVPGAQAKIGDIIFVAGDVKITDAQGKVRDAVRGTTIEEGEGIQTAPGASAQIRMVDQAFIAVRPDTSMKFERYQFQGKEDGKESAFMSIVRGGFRSITGLIGRANKTNYMVRTPVATIGIRGSDIEPMHFAAPPSPGEKPGTYLGVNGGQGVMTTQGGSQVVNPNQVAHAPDPNTKPQLLPAIPGFMRPAQTVAAGGKPKPGAGEKPAADKPAAEKPQAEQVAEKPAAKPAAGEPQQQAAAKPGAPAPGGQPSGPTEQAQQSAGSGQAASPAQQQAAAPSPVSGGSSSPEPIRSTAVVDAPQQVAAGMNTAVSTPPVTPPSTAPATPTTPAPEKIVIPVTATTNNTASGTTATLNATTEAVTQGTFVYNIETKQTTNVATGQTFTVSNTTSGGTLTIADFGKLATDEAALAVAAKNSVNTISTTLATSAGTTPTVAYNTASTANTTAQADASAIAAIAAIDTTTAANNLASINTAATTAATTQSAAAAKNAANGNVTNGVGGTDFRDSTAAAALAALNTANTAVQTAKTSATTSNTSAGTQSTTLASSKTSAVTQASTASTALTAAQAMLNTLTGTTNVDTGATNPNQTVANLLSLANTAATSANTHAALAVTAQNNKDYTTAQAEYKLVQDENKKAQAYLTLAQQIQTVISNGTTVGTAQGQLATLKTNATSAKTAGDAAVSAVATQLATVNTNASTVQSNAAVAQYSNPTIVTTNRFGSIVLGAKAATSGSELVSATAKDQANTNYVLDGTSNLVQARSTNVSSGQLSGGTPVSLTGADMKVSGGTAADTSVTFLDAANTNGPSYIALGRWTGSAASPLVVTLNGTQTLNLGTNSLHWITAYQPPSFFAQSRAGTTTYTQLAATKPTDAAGNVGTLTTATLSADFDAQKVTAAIGVTVSTKTVSGSGQFNISGNGFSGNFSTVTTGYVGSLQGVFAGDKATGVAAGYSFYPTASTTVYTDLIQGVVAFSTNTAPAQAPFAATAQAAANAALAAKNSISTISTTLGATKAGLTPTQAVTTATTANTAAQADATTVGGLAAIDTATATSNLASINTAATTAAATQSAAATKNAANANVTNGVGGTDFRDSTAAAALTAMNTANTAIQNAKTTATSANTSAGTQSTTLTANKASATTQATSATSALGTAQTTLTAITAAANVDAGATNPNQTIANLLTLANTAATNAQTAATSANNAVIAGNLTQAQTDMQTAQAENTKAQNYLSLAQQIQTVINNGDTVATAQTQLASLKTSATGAKTTGDTAVGSVASALATVNTNAPAVQNNAATAQYSNPTIVTTNRFGSILVGAKAAATSGNEAILANTKDQANTNYVLDGSSNLAQVRSTNLTSAQLSGGTPVNATAADLKVSGGVAADASVTFLDASATNGPNYVALGRWTGTTASPLVVTLNGTQALNLGTNSLHWITAYQPPTSYAQSRAGVTAYTQLAATKPTDAAGNVGTLTSATLSADFDAQKVTAAIGVTVATKIVSGSGQFNMTGNGFSGNFSTVTTGYAGSLQGAFAGDKATGVGVGYTFYPSASTTVYTDLIQGVVAFSTTTAPAQAPFAASAQAAATAALAAKNSIGTISTTLGATKAGLTPTQAFNTATTSNTAAQADATAVAGVAAVDTTTAANNVAAIGTKVTAATTAVTTATNNYNANGTFRDSTAVAALTAMNTANTALQANQTNANTANTTATTQATTLTTAKTTAATQSGSATTALGTAQTTVTTLTAATNVDAGATNPNQTINNLLALANTAATNAQTAATSAANAVTAGNLTQAQTDMQTAQAENTKAQAYLTLAQQIQTVINNGDTVAAAQTQLATLKTTANTAKSAGDTAVAATTTELTSSNTNAASVTQQAVIAQYNNPAVASTTGFGHTLAGSVNTGTSQYAKMDGGTSGKANTNYVLDANRNLVEIRSTNYSSGNFGTAASPSYSNADVVFSGGTAADSFKATDNSLYLGRWQGGTVKVDDLSNGAGVDTTVTLGTQSVHWLIALQPAANYAQTKLTGTSTYTLLANTSPTDTAGNVGTLNSATLTADFTNRTVSAGINATVNARTYAMTINNMAITSNDFSGTGTPTCTGATCTGTYAGEIVGAFAKADASGAGFKYGLWPTTAGVYADLIRGVAAFTTATAPALIPQPATTVATAFNASGSVSNAQTFDSRGQDWSDNGAGSVTAAAANPQNGTSRSITFSGGTAQNVGNFTTTGGTTVNFGRWQGGSATVVSNAGVSTTNTLLGSAAWIRGPVETPIYQGNALTATVTYTKQGNTTPVDQSNTAGTLNTSTLSVNFLKQAVSFGIDATIGANQWVANGTDVKLEGGTTFYASTNTSAPHTLMSLTLNGSTTGTYGNVSGALFGAGVDAAGLTYAFGANSGATTATGAIAYSATAQNQAASFTSGVLVGGRVSSPVTVVGGTLDPVTGNQGPQTVTPTLTGTNTFNSQDAQYNNYVQSVVSANASARTSRFADSAGNLGTELVFKADAVTPTTAPLGCTTSCTGVNTTPVSITFQPSNFGQNSAAPPSTSSTTASNSLSIADYGKDATTGIQWGRYIGFVQYTDRIGTTNGIAQGLIDARTNNWHGIWAPAQTSAPQLPTTGTFTYTAVGGTSPTDSAGNVGTWSTSTTTLTANFTNMTVNTAVNATVGGNTWAATATNIPIQTASFVAGKGNGLSNLTVTSSVAGTTAGLIQGQFTGNAASGTNGGALIGYSLSAGSVTMSGVSAFKK